MTALPDVIRLPSIAALILLRHRRQFKGKRNPRLLKLTIPPSLLAGADEVIE
jgi:hypothetical protein